MKMKKLLALICASVLAIGALTACSSKEEAPAQSEATTPAETDKNTEATGLQDGTYRAEYDKEDSRGWKAFVEVTVADGQMTEVNFDYINADGALAESLIASQDPTKVDAVTGATSSSEEFVTFTTALMEQMQAGNTEVLVLAAPAE